MGMSENNRKLYDEYKYFILATKQVEKGERVKNTVLAYCSDVKQFLSYLNEEDCLNLKPLHTNGWMTSPKENGDTISNATWNRRLSSMNGFYKYMCKYYGCNNPFEELPIKKVEIGKTQKEADILEKSEIEILLKYLDKKIKEFKSENTAISMRREMLLFRNRALVNFILVTGMRVEEVCGLTFDNITFMKSENILKIEINELDDKNRKGRKIYVDGSIYNMIRQYINSIYFATDNNYVFLSVNGKQMTQKSILDLIQTSLNGAGICKCKRITPHSFRHTCATELKSTKYSTRDIANMLGHSEAMYLNRYCHDQEEGAHVIARF